MIALASAPAADGLLSVRLPDHPRLSPDGTGLAAVVDVLEGGVRRRRLWLAPADAPEQGELGVELDLAAGPPAWSPDGQRLAVTVRRAGQPQIALVARRNPRTAEGFTRLPTGARDPVWSADGAWLAFESRVFPDCSSLACQKRRLSEASVRPERLYEEERPRRWARWRDGRVRHLWRQPLDGGPPEDLTPDPAPALAEPEGPEPRYAFLGPEGWVYVGEAPLGEAREVDSDLFLLEPGRPPARLTESPGRDFAPAAHGDRLLYLAGPAPGDGAKTTEVRVLRLGEAPRSLLPGLDLPVRAVLPFGPGALVIVDRAGHRPLLFAPLGGGRTVDRIAKGTVHAAHAAGSRIAAVVSGLLSPPEIWVLGPDGRVLGRSGLNTASAPIAARVREVEAPGPGGPVRGFLVAPDRDGRNPVVVLLHGGPESAWTDGWHPRWNPLPFVAAGWTVLMPNLAGSVGYGAAFADRVRASWGGAPHDDLGAFLTAADAWPEVGAPRAAAGASFGGFLVAWALAHGDLFSCGVSHAGVFDPAALWGETDSRWFPEEQFGGPPWAPGAVYERWSPARYAHRIRAPMLLTHGDRDHRVPIGQSLRLFSTLKRRGLPVRFLRLRRQGHFVRDPPALVAWQNEILGFLDECLGAPPTALGPLTPVAR